MKDIVDELKHLVSRIHAEAREMDAGRGSVSRKAADAIAVQAERLKQLVLLDEAA